ncbi:MAG: aminoacyl-tRNA hydrolase [Candidatus Babeliales bacterium]
MEMAAQEKNSTAIIKEVKTLPITAIIGLGNPGSQYYYNRHNIGFRVVDELARKHGGIWESKKDMETAEVIIHGKKILLVKPETFMNASGNVIPLLKKQGIKAENILVIHDELEKPFNKLAFKIGGSHRGHNGLRSLITACGPDFARLRFGIGRPEVKEEVGTYVLQNFSQNEQEVEHGIGQAVTMIEQLFESE